MLSRLTGPAVILMSVFLSAANAATEAPDPGLEQVPESSAQTKGEMVPDSSTETLDVTQPKIPTREEKVQMSNTSRETFYPYQSSISPRLGYIAYDQNNTSGSQLYLLGFSYMADSPLSEHWEMGADLVSNSSGYFFAGKKWIFMQHSSFRPFLKTVFAILIEPNKALGSFIEFRNYQVRGGGGLEYLLISPMSLRLDLELGVGLRGAWSALILGYSWAW